MDVAPRTAINLASLPAAGLAGCTVPRTGEPDAGKAHCEDEAIELDSNWEIYRKQLVECF